MLLVLSACCTLTVSPVFIFAHFHNVPFFYAVNGFTGRFDNDAFSVILKVLLDFPRGRNGHLLADRHLTVFLFVPGVRNASGFPKEDTNQLFTAAN